MIRAILYLLVVFSTNVIQGITGFAGTVLAMPFTILLYGIDVAKPSLTILTALACLFITARNFRHIAWREFFKIILLMFAGVLAGEAIYPLFQTGVLLQIYAVFIIAIALLGLLKRKDRDLPEAAMCGCVLLAGVIHGMFISGGPLLIIYAVRKLPDKNRFRATLSLIWICLDLYLIIKQYAAGLLTASTLSITALGIPMLLLGVLLGSILAKKMSQALFLKLTYVLLIISGASLLLN